MRRYSRICSPASALRLICQRFALGKERRSATVVSQQPRAVQKRQGTSGSSRSRRAKGPQSGRNADKRGQAAIEYLITYGWAFIVILITIGALAYFGFLDPQRYTPSRCDFGSQLECVDYKLDSTTSPGDIYLRFRNNFGDNIEIVDIRPITYTGTGSLLIATDTKVAKGDTSETLQIKMQGTEYVLTKDDRIAIQLNVTFKRDIAGAPSHSVYGEVFTSVQ